MITLEYERKGIDYWYYLQYDSGDIHLTIGSGIVPDVYWDKVLTSFFNQKIRVLERRLQ